METNSSIVHRTLKSSDGSEFTFPFLVVDSPEKWLAASQFSSQKRVPNTNVAIAISGVPYGDYEKLEAEFPIPPNVSDKDPSYDKVQESRERAITKRNVRLIEISTGKEIPGEDMDAKCNFLRSRGKSGVDEMMSMISDIGCCWNDSNQSTALITQYKALCEQKSVELVDSPLMSWAEAEKSEYFFWLQRPCDDYITEFRLRGITGEKNDEIIKKTDPGNPPMRVITDPRTKRFAGQEPNYSDPAWVNKSRMMQKRQLIMLLDAIMPFPVPGNNEQEKAEWVGKRLVGDVVALKRFIDMSITSYASELSFF